MRNAKHKKGGGELELSWPKEDLAVEGTSWLGMLWRSLYAED